MSYANVVTGLHERFATVGGIHNFLDYEPTSIQRPPTLCSVLDSFERNQSGQVTAMRYSILSRLYLLWQENDTAEEALKPYVNSLPAAVDADQSLGGRASLARVEAGRRGFITVAGTLYLVLELTADVLEKGAYQSGI